MALLDLIKDGITKVVPASDSRRNTIPPPQGIGNVGAGHANFEDDVRPLCFSPPTQSPSSPSRTLHNPIVLFLLSVWAPRATSSYSWLSCLLLGHSGYGWVKPASGSHLFLVLSRYFTTRRLTRLLQMIVSKPMIVFHTSQIFFNFLAMCCFASVAAFQAKWHIGPCSSRLFAFPDLCL